MTHYRLAKTLIPAAEGTSFALPMQDLLAVTNEMDRNLNRVYVALVMAAGQGRFGPFAAEEVLALFAEFFPARPDTMRPPTLRQARKALARLEQLQLVIATD